MSDGATAPPRTIAVIVPTFQRAVQLEHCLRGLAAQTLRADRVVVAARTNDVETQAALPRLRTDVIPFESVTIERPGVIAALVAAVARCTEDVVAHVDDDAVPLPDWLERLLAHYGPGVGGVGGRDVLAGRASRVSERVGRVTPYGRYHGNHHLGDGPARDVDVLKGACMSMRRELWRPESGLRGAGAQVNWELEMCLHARRECWRLIYDPAIRVDHFLAPRHDGDREAPTLRARADAEWNYAYAIGRWLPPARAVAAAVYSCAVGSPRAPGLVRLVGRALRSRDVRASFGLFLAVNRARLQGLGAGLGRRARGVA